MVDLLRVYLLVANTVTVQQHLHVQHRLLDIHLTAMSA
jgi:hypothetical protein